uniref:Ig-like domain-containing protein n=1 Tax=Labrus bergylta TaxID=56723 RepID=A0A3Q3FMJ9_9LABR
QRTQTVECTLWEWIDLNLHSPSGQWDSLILRLEPNRLQFFEYESLIFHCEGSDDSTGLKIVHRSKGELLRCNTTVTSKRSSCTIHNIFPEDSGQYWCESRDGKRIDPVILESPISVVEGETVTLRCRHKMTFTNLSADFYKDGHLIRTNSTGNMSIPSVSKRDEGFYKCISGGRESAESLMAVQGETHQCYQIKFKNTCDITITSCLTCFTYLIHMLVNVQQMFVLLLYKDLKITQVKSHCAQFVSVSFYICIC